MVVWYWYRTYHNSFWDLRRAVFFIYLSLVLPPATIDAVESERPHPLTRCTTIIVGATPPWFRSQLPLVNLVGCLISFQRHQQL